MIHREIASPLNWYGGKGGSTQTTLRRNILSYIEKSNCTKFVDVFGGSGIISLNVKKEIIIYNDIYENLVNFFEIIKDQQTCTEFIKQLTLTTYNESIYKRSIEKLETTTDKIDRAICFYVRTMQSRNSTGALKDNETWSYSKKGSRRGMAQAVSRYLRNVDENLPNAIEKIREWQIINDDYLKCLNRWDDEKTIFYLDPPYLDSTRNAKAVYKNEFTEDQHKSMVKKLLTIQGNAIVSGYDNKIYDELIENGWHKITCPIHTSTSPDKENSTRNEVLWCKEPVK